MKDGAPQRPPRGGDGFHDSRARDAAFALPLFGLVLVAPPFANLFVTDLTILGAPVIGVYLFTVWAVLIYCARRLSRRLGEGGPR